MVKQLESMKMCQREIQEVKNFTESVDSRSNQYGAECHN